MARRRAGGGTLVVAALLAGALGPPAPGVAQELGEQAQQQLRAIFAEKASRTPAQRKLDTSLLYASRESRGLAMVQGLAPRRRVADRARVDASGKVVVHIRGEVTDRLLQTIAAQGGKVAASLPAYGAVRAVVPIRQVEAIAELPEVRSIRPPSGFLVNAGTQTSEGDAAHTANLARANYSLDGTGVKIGVLSDGVDSLDARQASGDLPPTCAATPGPGACVKIVQVCSTGAPPGTTCGDEGTAMMEVIHDLAPGAQLYFAGLDLDPLEEEFAANILALRNTYGCHIIVDNVTFFGEGAFQDGVIARAVNAVKNAGVLYFSSAGNSGRKSAGTSGTWEGDFLNSGTIPPLFVGGDYGDKQFHSWDGLTGSSSANTNPLTALAPYQIWLQWSDPLGGAVTDYDMYLLDSTLSEVVDWSSWWQDCPPGSDPAFCSDEPTEWMGYGEAGERILVVAWSGPRKALRLDTFQGRLTHSTPRATFGHNGGEGTISVAATDARVPGAGNPFVGGTTNPVETYSSDGPRRLFYDPNGSAITPGNVLFATNGGRDLKKPDITAADCVVTGFSPTTPPNPLNPFCGTSAAVAHAAAIGALLKSAPNNPGAGQVLAALSATALDVTPITGWDRDSGVGIVMADAALGVLTTLPPALDFYTVNPCRVVDTRLTGGAIACGTARALTMVGGTCGVPTGAKAVSLNVTVTQPSATGNLRVWAAGTPAPLASNINYAGGQTRANNAISPLSTAGQIAVLCSPTGTAHVIVDVNGYFK